MLHRRHMLTGLAALAASPALTPAWAQPRGRQPLPFDPAIAAIERKYGGRLGVFALDTATHKTMAWRPDERFNMCSTFKLLLAAQLLAKVDAGGESLSRKLFYGPGDLMSGSPVTTRHAEEGASASPCWPAPLSRSATMPPPTCSCARRAGHCPSPVSCARWMMRPRAPTVMSPTAICMIRCSTPPRRAP
jgi:hypothetical protein